MEINSLREALAKRDAEETMVADTPKKTRTIIVPERFSPQASPTKTVDVLTNSKEFGKRLGEETTIFKIGASKYNCFDSGFSRGEYVNLLRHAFCIDPKFATMTFADLVSRNAMGYYPNLIMLTDAYPVPHDNMGFFMNNPETPQNKLKMRYATMCMLKPAQKPPAGPFVFGGPAKM